METPARNYDKETLLLLSGKIRRTRYIKEVQEILVKKGIERTDNYVAQVTQPDKNNNFRLYNEDVWDAIIEVLNKRKLAREQNAMRAAMALAD